MRETCDQSTDVNVCRSIRSFADRSISWPRRSKIRWRAVDGSDRRIAVKLPRASVKRITSTFRAAALGDPRRTARLEHTLERMARKPQATMPEAMGSSSELEGAYRLFNNPRVTLDALVEAHAYETARRARAEPAVIAIHDTTTCKFAHADPAVV